MRQFILRATGSWLSPNLQREIKRLRYARQIARGRFQSSEPDYQLLNQWVNAGDAVIDIGANVGHYTLGLSKLVGAAGRVLAFEPVPTTFAHLAANVSRAGAENVTLINAAVSNQTRLVQMEIPDWVPGVRNYYQAHLSSAGKGLPVLSLTLGDLTIPLRVALVKIDAEGHELEVLQGMSHIIERDHPVFIVEQSDSTVEFLTGQGYRCGSLPESPNFIMLPAHCAWPSGLQAYKIVTGR